MRRSCGLILLVSFLSLSACGHFTEDTSLEITADRTVYPRGTTIRISAKNTSRHVLYYNSCMKAVLEEVIAQKVARQIPLPTCDCLCTTALAPEQVYDWVLDVDWLYLNEGMFEPNSGQRHRLRLEFYEDSKLSKLLPGEERTTGTFRFEH